jgi:hypothetical protein
MANNARDILINLVQALLCMIYYLSLRLTGSIFCDCISKTENHEA